MNGKPAVTADQRIEVEDLLIGLRSESERGDLEDATRNILRRAVIALTALHREQNPRFIVKEDGSIEPMPEVPDGWQLVPKEPTPEMLEAALDESGQRVAPYTAPRESGVATECDMSEEDAADLNEQFKAAHGDTYRTMLAAAPKCACELPGADPLGNCEICQPPVIADHRKGETP